MLELESGNKSAAARLLGVSRKTLDRKCRAWEAEEG
ncbi:helix-turn-helix domain-containing protein [Solemya velum gill symbiont]|nr:helix-turn-helix domain-containing protein [Solemya velum gill symbiont]